MNMNIKFAAALTALALTATVALPTSEAQAGGRGWAIGAGLIGAGIVAGSIAAAAQPVYVDPAYGYRYRCRYVDRFDQWGNFAGTVKVCG
jgi:hypothetical protein